MKRIPSCVGCRLVLFLLLHGLVGGGAGSPRSTRMLHPEQKPQTYGLRIANTALRGAEPKRTLRASNETIAVPLMPCAALPERPCQPKRLIHDVSFSVDNNAKPIGKMGDVDDVTIEKEPGLVRFNYTTSGKGSHEWEYKYEDGVLNPNPAQFGGVMYLDQNSNFGTRCAGFDLTGMRVVRWKARSVGQNVVVEFRIGGLKWIWDSQRRVKVDPPTPIHCQI
jgi:hypothetical protein